MTYTRRDWLALLCKRMAPGALACSMVGSELLGRGWDGGWPTFDENPVHYLYEFLVSSGVSPDSIDRLSFSTQAAIAEAPVRV